MLKRKYTGLSLITVAAIAAVIDSQRWREGHADHDPGEVVVGELEIANPAR